MPPVTNPPTTRQPQPGEVFRVLPPPYLAVIWHEGLDRPAKWVGFWATQSGGHWYLGAKLLRDGDVLLSREGYTSSIRAEDWPPRDWEVLP